MAAIAGFETVSIAAGESEALCPSENTRAAFAAVVRLAGLGPKTRRRVKPTRGVDGFGSQIEKPRAGLCQKLRSPRLSGVLNYEMRFWTQRQSFWSITAVTAVIGKNEGLPATRFCAEFQLQFASAAASCELQKRQLRET